MCDRDLFTGVDPTVQWRAVVALVPVNRASVRGPAGWFPGYDAMNTSDPSARKGSIVRGGGLVALISHEP